MGAQALLGSAQEGTGFEDNLQAAKEEESPALHSNSSDSDLNSDNAEDAQAAYKLPYQARSLSDTIANVMDSRLQSNRLHTLKRDLKLKSLLLQLLELLLKLLLELQQDKEAQSLPNSLRAASSNSAFSGMGREDYSFIHKSKQNWKEASSGILPMQRAAYRALRCCEDCCEPSSLSLLLHWLPFYALPVLTSPNERQVTCSHLLSSCSNVIAIGDVNSVACWCHVVRPALPVN